MKRLLVGLAFAGGVAVSVLAVKQLVSTEAVKAELAEQLASYAGIPVAVKGTAEIDVFPALRVRYRDVEIRARDGDRFAVAESVSVRLDILPLLVGRLSVAEVALDRPVLTLPGRFDWRDLIPARGLLTRVDPSRFVVTDGRLIATDAAGRTETLDNLSATLLWPRAGSGASLSSTFRWRGEPVALAAQGNGPRDFAAGKTGALAFSLTSGPLRVGFDGKGLIVDMLQLDGALSVTVPDAERLAGWLGAETATHGALKQLSLEGRMRSLGYAATISNATLGADGNLGEGVLSIRVDTPRPQLRGTLAFETIDLATWTAALVKLDWPAMPLRRAELAAADLDLRVSVNRANAGTLRLDGIAATLLAKDGRFDAELGEVRLLGGSGSLLLRGETGSDGLKTTARASVANLSAQGLAALIGTTAISDGILSFTAEGEATGASVAAAVAGLNARIAADARSVALAKADPVTTSGTRYVPIAFRATGATRSATFERASADITIVGPTAFVRRLDAEGALMNARLSGEASLKTGVLSLGGELTMPPRPADAARPPLKVAFPVKIGGTLAKPVADIRAEDIIAEPSDPSAYPRR
jgi:AsmA protein